MAKSPWLALTVAIGVASGPIASSPRANAQVGTIVVRTDDAAGASELSSTLHGSCDGQPVDVTVTPSNILPLHGGGSAVVTFRGHHSRLVAGPVLTALTGPSLQQVSLQCLDKGVVIIVSYSLLRPGPSARYFVSREFISADGNVRQGETIERSYSEMRDCCGF